MNECEAREIACKVISDLKKNHPCPCSVHECPFKGTCELCIRNHLESNTLPACCLPDIDERNHISKHAFPTCRSPLLWTMIPKDEFKKLYDELPKEVQEKIKNNMKDLAIEVI